MNIIDLDIQEIVPNPNNPRVITSLQLIKLKKSLTDFPEMLKVRPLILDEHNIILAGNMRYKAAKELGFKSLPVVYASNLTDDEQRELLLKNNMSYGEWDWEMITSNFDMTDIRDWGLEVPSFFFDDDVEPEIEEEEVNRIKVFNIMVDRADYSRLLDDLNAVVRRESLPDYSTAVLFLMNDEDN